MALFLVFIVSLVCAQDFMIGDSEGKSNLVSLILVHPITSTIICLAIALGLLIAIIKMNSCWTNTQAVQVLTKSRYMTQKETKHLIDP